MQVNRIKPKRNGKGLGDRNTSWEAIPSQETVGLTRKNYLFVPAHVIVSRPAPSQEVFHYINLQTIKPGRNSRGLDNRNTSWEAALFQEMVV